MVPFSSLQDTILSQVQRIVKGEVNLAMKEQQAVVTSSIMQAMRSAAGTPVPTAHLDYQTQQANILQFLQQGQLNQAFQQVTQQSAHSTFLLCITDCSHTQIDQDTVTPLGLTAQKTFKVRFTYTLRRDKSTAAGIHYASPMLLCF